MECKHCQANLDGGEIYQALKNESPSMDPIVLIQFAYRMGWTTQNKRHFNKCVIRKTDDGKLAYCPFCHKIDPLPSSDDSIPITMEQ